MSAVTSKMNEGMEMTTFPNESHPKSTTKETPSISVFDEAENVYETQKNKSMYEKIVYIALFNAICAFLILLVVIILVLKSDNLGVKSNITTGGNFHTQTQEGRIIVNNIINHYTRNNISMKPNYTNIFDEPDIGPFEAFDFYSTGNTKPTRRIATNYPTAKPTVSPIDCSYGLNRLIESFSTKMKKLVAQACQYVVNVCTLAHNQTFESSNA
eukprot:92584_1